MTTRNMTSKPMEPSNIEAVLLLWKELAPHDPFQPGRYVAPKWWRDIPFIDFLREAGFYIPDESLRKALEEDLSTDVIQQLAAIYLPAFQIVPWRGGDMYQSSNSLALFTCTI
jgi:hypothetical protein